MQPETRDSPTAWFGGRTRLRLVLFAFGFSGTSGLMLELLWTRQLSLVFGTTETALSAVLAAFMGGLAAGSYWFGRREHPRRHFLETYARLEIGIAVTAVAVTALLSQSARVYPFLWAWVDGGAGVHLLQFAIAVLLLGLPTFLMGGTLPILAGWWEMETGELKGQGGRLYFANLIGAALGGLVAGFFILPSYGLYRVLAVAATLNVVAATIAWVLFLFDRGAASGHRSRIRTKGLRAAGGSSRKLTPLVLLLAAAAATGAAAIIQEVLWSRALRMVVGSSVYALTLMLVVFLAGLGKGSALAARLVDRVHRPHAMLATLQFGAAAAVLLGIALIPHLPALFLAGFEQAGSGSVHFVVQASLAALLMLPGAIFLGAMFPFMVKSAGGIESPAEARVGKVYAAQTIGNLVGALAALGFIALLGLRRSLVFVSGIHLVLAGGFLAASGKDPLWRTAVVTATAFPVLLLAALAPSWDRKVLVSGVYQEARLVGTLFPSAEDFFRALSQFHLLFYREGPTATVSVVEKPTIDSARHLALAIDGKVDASTGADMATQVLSAHLPLLLRNDSLAVCVVGWASGVTVGSVLLYPVREVTAIEIEPAVVAASSLFDEFNYRARLDPRLRLVVDDARTVFLRETRRYDVIISEPSNPWLAGPSKLFTKEFLELGKRRLDPGGIFVQWIQLYGLDPPLLRMFVRTFGSVFPYVLVFQTSEGDLLLLGSEAPLVLDWDRLAQAIGDHRIRQDLARVGVRDVPDLLTHFRFGDQELGRFTGTGPLNTDVLPALEFGAPRALYRNTIAENKENLGSVSGRLTAYVCPKPESDALAAVVLRALQRGDEQTARAFAAELGDSPASVLGWWVLGELDWRQKNFITAQQRWRRGVEADPACVGCAVSLALALQREGKFSEAEKALALTSSDPGQDPLIALLQGINRFYLGDRAGSVERFRLALSQQSDADDSLRGIIQSRMLPRKLLALFYVAYGVESRERAGSAAAQEALARTLSDWRMELIAAPVPASRGALLAAVEFHADRAAAAKLEGKLIALLTREVLEPLSHFDRALAHALTGNREGARKELAEAMSRVKEPAERIRMRKTAEKVIDWDDAWEK